MLLFKVSLWKSVICYRCFTLTHESLTYCRMRQINHARNIWDRAITVLPRANQFWYKYTYMEEMLGNIAGQCNYSVFFIFCFVFWKFTPL